MASFCRIILLHAAIFVLNLDTVLGGGMGRSLRGARVGLPVEDLHEADMPSLDETDVDSWPGEADDEQLGSAEVADSDENDDEQSVESAEVRDDNGDTIEYMTRIGTIADTNNDGVLSPGELKVFAEGLRNKKRWEHTKSALLALDGNGDGQVTREELGKRVAPNARSTDTQRFSAADWNGDGVLNVTEFHAFAHPDVHHMVLKVETDHQFGHFDRDGNNLVSFKEFVHDDSVNEDFSEEAAKEDYALHDLDGSGELDVYEFERLLAGHDLLFDSISKAISAVDSDGDGHISISEEVPNGIQGLLNSEFIEDFFYHEYAGRHDEL